VSARDILLVEPYFGGSHRAWAEGLRASTSHRYTFLTLPAEYWTWRMQAAAIPLARRLLETELRPDVVIATDMLNLAAFLGLARARLQSTPVMLYFHENQLTYPRNRRQRYGYEYALINTVSALAADLVAFNSAFHRDLFLSALPRMLRHFPDHNEPAAVNRIAERAIVLPPGLALAELPEAHQTRGPGEPLVILWNHRWDSDKNPEGFVAVMLALTRSGEDFRLIITGENSGHSANPFAPLLEAMPARILHIGWVQDRDAYLGLLRQADVVVSTAHQEYFGIAVLEAMAMGCTPVLPARQNYPHLIPPDLRSRVLYEADDALYERLANLIAGRSQPIAHERLRAITNPFAWSALAPEYDAVLTALAGARDRHSPSAENPTPSSRV
jgi:glycosyltransferase involved in cell wall biosynthesis